MKKNISLWILACGVIFAACERLDMVGMFAGSSPTIDERWEESMGAKFLGRLLTVMIF